MKLVIVCLIAFSGVALAGKPPGIALRTWSKPKVHDDIIKAHQIEMDKLAKKVLTASKKATTEIQEATSTQKSIVDNSVDTVTQDLNNINAMINAQFRKPAAKASQKVRFCLTQKLNDLDGIFTKSLNACYDTKKADELNKLKNDILLIRTTVNSLGETCRQLHLQDTDAGRKAMEECLTNGITANDALLTANVDNLNTKVADFKTETSTCVSTEEQVITDASKELPTAALQCLVP